MNFWKRLFGHFRTITKHRHKVIANCAKAGILWQGLRHDLSKYTPTEFVPGVKYYTGKRSPNEGEREEYGYSKAWMHHKGRNRHHYEYWVDYNLETKRNEPVEMPYNYVAEISMRSFTVCSAMFAPSTAYARSPNMSRTFSTTGAIISSASAAVPALAVTRTRHSPFLA